MTPHVVDRERRTSDYIGSRTHHRGFDRERQGDRSAENGDNRRPAPSQPVRKERSLSPYSRRLALTQSMNIVR
jgi:hypothetical protein